MILNEPESVNEDALCDMGTARSDSSAPFSISATSIPLVHGHLQIRTRHPSHLGPLRPLSQLHKTQKTVGSIPCPKCRITKLTVLSQPFVASWHRQIRQSDIPIPAISLVGEPFNQTSWLPINLRSAPASPPGHELSCSDHTPPDLA